MNFNLSFANSNISLNKVKYIINYLSEIAI